MSRKFNVVNHPARLLAIILVFVSFAPAQTAPAKPTDQQIIAKVAEYMAAAVKVDGFSGSVLIARDGTPIVEKGFGMANIEHDVPNGPATIYRLGSVTKQFTGMAIAMLQERGKLSVGDPLCKYITDCPAAWKPITVKNLLTHTSGIPNYTSFPDFAKTTILPVTNAEMISVLREKPLDFAPGEKFAYSNSGYYLLGEIIEKASGKTYSDFLQENIFTPLGMKRTGYDSPLRIIKNRAAGYVRQGGKVLNASYMDMTVPYAAGALYSTTGDLLLWDQALYTEKLVSKKSLAEIFTPLSGETGYGYGWGIRKRFGRREISHGGGIYGFATDIARFPDDRVTVVVLSNIQGAPAGRVSTDLAAIVFGADYKIPAERKEIAVGAEILKTYAGEYRIKQPSIVLSITFEDGKLLAQVAGQSKFVLAPESETKFFSRDVNATITFTKNADGKVTGLTLSQGGSGFPAEKIK
jgi:CubicO group peptidase (beta-lactamase class C family)